jgi:hypothetical protein
MAGNGQYRWYWSSSEELERCFGGKATRAEAVDAGHANVTADEFDEGQTPGFWIVEADTVLVHPITLSADELADMEGGELTAQWAIEQVLDANEDAYGEDGYEGPSKDADPEAEAALDSALKAIDRAAPDAADQINVAIRNFVVSNQAIFAPYLFGDTRHVEFVPLAQTEGAA